MPHAGRLARGRGLQKKVRARQRESEIVFSYGQSAESPTEPRMICWIFSNSKNQGITTVLAQLDGEGKERTTYYLSKLFNKVEKKYTVMEKTYAGVV